MLDSEGDEDSVNIIFHKDGKHLEQNYIRRVFKKILRIAGIRELRFHTVRHSFASILLTNGYSPVYVKEQLGHSSIQTTIDIYGHLIPSSNRTAVNSLDNPPESASERTLYASSEYTKAVTS